MNIVLSLKQVLVRIILVLVVAGCMFGVILASWMWPRAPRISHVLHDEARGLVAIAESTDCFGVLGEPRYQVFVATGEDPDAKRVLVYEGFFPSGFDFEWRGRGELHIISRGRSFMRSYEPAIQSPAERFNMKVKVVVSGPNG